MTGAINLWMARMLPIGVILAVVGVWTDGYRIYRARQAE